MTGRFQSQPGERHEGVKKVFTNSLEEITHKRYLINISRNDDAGRF